MKISVYGCFVFRSYRKSYVSSNQYSKTVTELVKLLVFAELSNK